MSRTELDAQTADLLAALAERNIYSRLDLELREGELDVERLADELGRHLFAYRPDGSPTCECDGPWEDDQWFEEHVAANILARLTRERTGA